MRVDGLSRISKDSIIKQIEKEMKKRDAFFVTKHAKVAASSLDKLRAQLRKSGTQYFAVKNSLAKRAFGTGGLEALGKTLEGSCGLVFSGKDAVGSCKILVDFSKTNENFKVAGGYLNGEIITVDQIKVLAALPPREVLIARVVGQMKAPISRLVGVLSGTLRKSVTVLDAVAKKKQNA